MVCMKNNIALSSDAKTAGLKDALSLFFWGLNLDSISTVKKTWQKILWMCTVYAGLGFPFGNMFDTVGEAF